MRNKSNNQSQLANYFVLLSKSGQIERQRLERDLSLVNRLFLGFVLFLAVLALLHLAGVGG